MSAVRPDSVRASMPEYMRTAFDLCEQFGFKPKFEFEYPTPDYKSKRIQIRAEKHVAPAAEITKYAEALRRGDKMPPLIVTRDGWLADGATRAGAAAKEKRPHFPALILDADYVGASEETVQRLMALGAAFNVRNGKGIDRGEIRKVVERIGLNPLYDATRIAALLGCTEAMVRSIVAEKKARDRLGRLGLALDERLIGAGQLRVLGRHNNLNDGPFAELASLTQEAGLTNKEISNLAKTMKAAKSDGAAIEIIQDERAQRHDQIAMRKATGGKTKPSWPRQLRQHLGFVLKFSNGSAHEAIEQNPAFISEHLRVVDDSILALQQIAAAQREHQSLI